MRGGVEEGEEWRICGDEHKRYSRTYRLGEGELALSPYPPTHYV